MGRIRVGKGFVVFIAVVSLCGCSGGGVSEHGVIRFSLDSSTFVILPSLNSSKQGSIVCSSTISNPEFLQDENVSFDDFEKTHLYSL